jgi:outer membrane protein assembly factor BamB
MIRKIIILMALTCLFITSCGVDKTLFEPSPHDWSVWRGPNNDGIHSSETIDPGKIPAELQEVWKVHIGPGFCSVSTRGKVFYTIGNDRTNDTVYCMNIETGEIIWSYSYKCAAGQYAGPRATPVLDGDVLYTLSRAGDLYCFEAMTGKVIWEKHLTKADGVTPNTWGIAGSPVIAKNVLILNVSGYGMGLDKTNGAVKWQSPPGIGGYASPVLYEEDGKTNAVIFGEKTVCGIRAKSGELLWFYPWETDYDVNAADPIVAGSRVFVSSGYNSGCGCIDFTDNNATLVWKNKTINSHFSNFIYKDGYVYGLDGDARYHRGRYKCIDFNTGEEMWSESIGFGNVLATEEHLFCITERGHIIVASLSPDKFNELYRGRFKTNQVWGQPVLHKGKIFLKDSMTGFLHLMRVQS